MYYGIRHCWRSFVDINPFLSSQLRRNRWGNGGTKDLVTFPLWAKAGLNGVSVTYNLVLTSRGLFINEGDLCLEREVNLSHMAIPTRQKPFRRTSYLCCYSRCFQRYCGNLFHNLLWKDLATACIKRWSLFPLPSNWARHVTFFDWIRGGLWDLQG